MPYRRTIRLVALWVSVVTATGCASTPPPATPASQTASAIPSPAGVDNFGVVSDDVWRGAKPTALGLRSLQAMGVRTVIDLQSQDLSADVPPGLVYVPLRVSGWHADRVDTAAVLRAIDECPKPVYIHCRQGRDRTGLAVAAYQLAQGATAAAALADLNRYGVNLWWRIPIGKQIRRLAEARAAS